MLQSDIGIAGLISEHFSSNSEHGISSVMVTCVMRPLINFINPSAENGQGVEMNKLVSLTLM